MLILLRADRAHTATNCDEASNRIKRLEKNGPFGNALDAEIDDTIHFEISPVRSFEPSATRIETGRNTIVYRNNGTLCTGICSAFRYRNGE